MAAVAQPYSADELRSAITSMRAAERGPFAGIRWFCPDGRVIPAQQRCGQPGGIQHAIHSEQALQIRARNGIWLAQILAGTEHDDFLDAANGFSRARQYELERFLQLNDNGWILERARFYRGAIQAEDEEAWGRDYLTSVLAADSLVDRHFFWLRRQVRTIPHAAGERVVDRVRALAKTLSDAYPAFLNLRIKIHGQPDASDLPAVQAFLADHEARMGAGNVAEARRLIADLTTLYGTTPSEAVRSLSSRVAASSPVKAGLESFAASLDAGNWEASTEQGAALLVAIRERTHAVSSGASRLLLLDLSLAVEDALFWVVSNDPVSGTDAQARRALLLSRAAYGAGYVESWEWAELEPRFAEDATDAEALKATLDAARSTVEWSIGLAMATYGSTMRLYAPFEPLANAFVDDVLRASIMLPLGSTVSQLADVHARMTGSNTRIMGLAGGGGVRGLNPGFAHAVLEVVSGDAEHIDLVADRIYVMDRPPAEMKPVAGIATVSEGNAVSHVQLLARNLGIPNAVVTPEVVTLLKAHHGERVFYAVSPGGSVLIKPGEEMTQEERDLVETKERSDERVRVPTARLDLDHMELTDLFALRASDSGRLCGPKAANLGQLSDMFPGHVAPGFIVPFGVFRAHMAQPMPDTDGSYWEYLRAAFAEADAGIRQGQSVAAVEDVLLDKLTVLRAAIESMPFLPGFRDQVDAAYRRSFSSPLGTLATFIRSDTNMEDLADFSGAGLNLTVPNVIREEDVLQGIRRVWASPYRERSYRWRQKYLLNPEDVYPSILILQSVPVDRSGVMITTGISSGRSEDVTLAFSRGVGGAVDGQAAETWLMAPQQVTLLSPAREPAFRALPATGGTVQRRTSYERRILSERDLAELRRLSTEVRTRLPEMPGMQSAGPWDVELGFLGDALWLFQMRPFVENRAAGSTTYLQNMDGPARQPNRRRPNAR